MATTAKYNISLQQGASFERKFVWKGANKRPINLTGWSAVLQVRVGPGQPILIELSTANGGIELGGIQGTIKVKLSATQTQALTFTSAVYDLKLIPPSGAGTLDRRLMEGKVTLSPAVTVIA